MAQSCRRFPVVGVIGGDERTGCARLVGRELTKRACVILTGGQAVDVGHTTKNAALMGAIDAEQYGEGVARYIGILPNSSHGIIDFESISKTQLLIHTQMSSMERDPINGVTPDILICFAGGQGTICELAFGIAVGREAVFHGHSAQLLLDKCMRSIERRNIRRNIEAIAHQWEAHLNIRCQKGRTIVDGVIDYLHQAVSRPVLWTAPEIVLDAWQRLPTLLPEIPTFPGIPQSDYTKQIDRFASYWKLYLHND